MALCSLMSRGDHHDHHCPSGRVDYPQLLCWALLGAKRSVSVGDHRVELAQERRALQQRASLFSSRSVSNGPGRADE